MIVIINSFDGLIYPLNDLRKQLLEIIHKLGLKMTNYQSE